MSAVILLFIIYTIIVIINILNKYFCLFKYFYIGLIYLYCSFSNLILQYFIL